MRMEHMTRGGSDFVFVSGNYKLQTKACYEWLYVVGDENGRRLMPPASVMEHGRVIHPIDELLQKPRAKAAKLTREEMIAIVMYTGPCFVIYNAVLRQFPLDIYTVFKDGNNLFPTTIFVLVSAVNKLSRYMNIGADISEFSQYPAEKEFLFVPYSFIQSEGRQRTEVVAGGGVLTLAPVRVNINLKTETTEELKEKKKRLHMVSACTMLEEVRYELGQWAASAEAAERLLQDSSRNDGGTFTAATLCDAIVCQCAVVVKRHQEVGADEYVDDGVFRALVNEILDAKAWAKEKKWLWMRNHLTSPICWLQGWSLRECHRMWQSFLRKTIRNEAAGSRDKANSSVEILVSQGLVKRGVRGEENADGEDVMVQAGSDGWAAVYVEAALAAGADVGAVDRGGGNCLWHAAQYGHVDTMAALIAARVDVNKCNNDGRSPIYIAAGRGHTDCVKILLSANGDVNKCSNSGASLIYITVQNGQTDCLPLLLSADGDVNKCTNDGRSPIYIAALNGHFSCMKLLLSAGGNPNISFKGTAALDFARQNGHTECVRALEAALS
jgi:ankyrin repeat protein